MKKILIFSLLLFPFLINAQEEIAVKESIQDLFVGIQTKDTAKIAAVFTVNATLETINEHGGFVPEIEKTEIKSFLKNIAEVPANVKLEEKVLSWDIRVDGLLATAWTDYVFYVNDEFSHCGVNAIQLFKVEGS